MHKRTHECVQVMFSIIFSENSGRFGKYWHASWVDFMTFDDCGSTA